MSALDDARAVLRNDTYDTLRHSGFVYRDALAALVAEHESERAQLGELLVRAVEACAGHPSEEGLYVIYSDDEWSISGVAGADGAIGTAYDESAATLPDALRALLAKVEPQPGVEAE